MKPICPDCHAEMQENGENDFHRSYYCCVCKHIVNIYDMSDIEPCEE